MSSLFSQTTKPSSDALEATVMSVDAQRYACTVKTVKGQRYSNVQWLSDSGGYGRDTTSTTPKMGDRVYLSTALGYPVIVGCLPRVDRNPTTPANIDSGVPIADTGKLSTLEGTSLNSGKPGDFLAGDKIFGSDGGGIIGLLRGGTILLKSSRLAQIILSKIDDGVKIVGRSVETHGEVGSDVYASIKGRVYRWVGLARTPSESRQGLFRYQEFYGDTLTAEALKDNYEIGGVGTLPAGGGSLKKVLIVDENSIPLRIEETDLEGNLTVTTRAADGIANNVNYYSKGQSKTTTTNGPAINVVDQTSGVWELTTTNGTYCKIKVTNENIFLTYNNDPTILMDATGIHLQKGTSKVDMLADSILMTNGPHFVNITPAGVQMG